MNSSTHARPGWVKVCVEDGTFDVVTSHRYGDGVVVGEHKVIIRSNPVSLASAEYGSPNTTPLAARSKDSPFTSLVKRLRILQSSH